MKTILTNDINLYSWHYPLDVHEKFGNNVQLAKILNIKILGKISPFVFWGKFKKSLLIEDFLILLTKKLKRKPLHIGNKNIKSIKNVAWCCGAGQKFFEQTIEKINIDAFITGEISEQNTHVAKENKIHFFSAGHHATERYGIQKLGNWLIKKYKLEVKFIDINNPI